MAGKGSRPRPFSIPLEELANRHEEIFGKKVKAQYVPPPLPDMSDDPKKTVDWGTEIKDSPNGG
jgi:hypothetical protein